MVAGGALIHGEREPLAYASVWMACRSLPCHSASRVDTGEPPGTGPTTEAVATAARIARKNDYPIAEPVSDSGGDESRIRVANGTSHVSVKAFHDVRCETKSPIPFASWPRAAPIHLTTTAALAGRKARKKITKRPNNHVRTFLTVTGSPP